MITILLQGGLGNQMFQYALGEVLRSQGKQVNFIAPNIDMNAGERPHDRGKPSYGLGAYDTTVNFVETYSRHVYNQAGCGYDPKVFEMDDVTLVGYWQSEKYFDHWHNLPTILGHPLCHRFFPVAPPPEGIKKVASRVSDDDSVLVQVRRGDFLAFPHFHGVGSPEYYIRGIAMTGKKNVFIVTDDEAWCRENLPGEIVNTGSRHWDIVLMAGANSLVISNSSFGWWGAWLGDNNFKKPGRKVVVPAKWFTAHVTGMEDIVPKRWKEL
jgi:hypothetical protein